ncbi:uncharacterized protein PAC_04581 [Phialocephala subalpina]|uniref:Uncharacterized protein n=1 Tax=Phialocephala subalpina TaxID=576137 RepID=A0A1L7WPJ1_9HELO|nr:uncharacterized protein PAC_04581 [Phialocephala subalpina]
MIPDNLTRSEIIALMLRYVRSKPSEWFSLDGISAEYIARAEQILREQKILEEVRNDIQRGILRTIKALEPVLMMSPKAEADVFNWKALAAKVKDLHKGLVMATQWVEICKGVNEFPDKDTNGRAKSASQQKKNPVQAQVVKAVVQTPGRKAAMMPVQVKKKVQGELQGVKLLPGAPRTVANESPVWGKKKVQGEPQGVEALVGAPKTEAAKALVQGKKKTQVNSLVKLNDSRPRAGDDSPQKYVARAGSESPATTLKTKTTEKELNRQRKRSISRKRGLRTMSEKERRIQAAHEQALKLASETILQPLLFMFGFFKGNKTFINPSQDSAVTMIDALPSKLEILVLVKRYNDISRSKDQIKVSLSKDEVKGIERLEQKQVAHRGRYIDSDIHMAASMAKPYLDNILALSDLDLKGFPWSEAEKFFHALLVSTNKQKEVNDKRRVAAAKKRAEEIKEHKVWGQNLEKLQRITEADAQKKIEDQKKAEEQKKAKDKADKAEALKKAQTDAAKKIKATEGVKLQKQQAPKISMHQAKQHWPKNVNSSYTSPSHVPSTPQAISFQNQIIKSRVKSPDRSPAKSPAKSPVKSPAKSPTPHPQVPVKEPRSQGPAPTTDKSAAKDAGSDFSRIHEAGISRLPQPSPPATPPQLPPRAQGDRSPVNKPLTSNVKVAAAAPKPKSPQLKPLKPALKKSIQNLQEEPGMKTWVPGRERAERPGSPQLDDNDPSSEKAEKARKAHEEALALRFEVRKF